MKKIICTFALILVLCGSALALTDAEYLKMKKDPNFTAADKKLAQVYKEVRDSMTESDFEKLKREQLQWIKKGRDMDGEIYLNVRWKDRRKNLLEISLDYPSDRQSWKGEGVLRGNIITANYGGTVYRHYGK